MNAKLRVLLLHVVWFSIGLLGATLFSLFGISNFPVSALPSSSQSVNASEVARTASRNLVFEDVVASHLEPNFYQ
jgi:hypothetical protein